MTAQFDLTILSSSGALVTGDYVPVIRPGQSQPYAATLPVLLANMASVDYVAGVLSPYATTASVTAALSGYASTSSVTATLSGYVTTAALAPALAPFATISSVTGLLTSYATTAAVTAAIAAAGGVSTIEFAQTNVHFPASVVAGTQQSFLAYQITDSQDLSNLLLLSLEIKDVTGNGSKFDYALYAGDPVAHPTTATKLFGSAAPITTGGGNINTDFIAPATSYLLNASLRLGVYMAITNRLTSPITLGFKVDFLKLPPVTSPVTLPDYVPGAAFTYTGPSPLSATDVGPGQTFPEMADAIAFMAPGFTMTVHAGTYYRPFRIPAGLDGWTIQAAAGVTADGIICNGRGGWITGYPLFPDNNPSTPPNPFRLSQGKGFIQAQCPGTVRKLGFWYCGGGYGGSVLDGSGNQLNIGQGEAGIYAELFPSGGATLLVDRCTFDGNANGVFAPHGSNVNVMLTNCDFSAQVPNGQTPDGLSHNVYIQGPRSEAVNTNFWDCLGNTFKSRSAVVNITGGLLMQGNGRAIDFPEGGTLTVNNVHFSQKSYAGISGTRILNFMGIQNENQNNGHGIASFNNCSIDIAYEALFYMGVGATATWSNTTINWYDLTPAIGARVQAFDYDVASVGGTAAGVTGLQPAGQALPFAAPAGTTFIIGYPIRPTTLQHLA